MQRYANYELIPRNQQRYSPTCCDSTTDQRQSELTSQFDVVTDGYFTDGHCFLKRFKLPRNERTLEYKRMSAWV